MQGDLFIWTILRTVICVTIKENGEYHSVDSSIYYYF